jgi:hypothetical protein
MQVTRHKLSSLAVNKNGKNILTVLHPEFPQNVLS